MKVSIIPVLQKTLRNNFKLSTMKKSYPSGTRRGTNWKLIYKEEFKDKTEALKIEKRF